MNRGIREENRRRISEEIQKNPKRADSWIAEDLSVSMQTVKNIRKSLEADGKIDRCQISITRNGREYPRSINELYNLKERILEDGVERDVLLVKKYVWPNVSESDIRAVIVDARQKLFESEIKSGNKTRFL